MVHGQIAKSLISICAFVTRCLKHSKEKVRYWATFNEMNHIDSQSEASGYLFTYIIAGLKYSEIDAKAQTLAMIDYNMTLASCAAVKMGHEIDENFLNWLCFWYRASLSSKL